MISPHVRKEMGCCFSVGLDFKTRSIYQQIPQEIATKLYATTL